MEDFLKPEEIINSLEIRENMTAAEFGCGAGTFVSILAKRLKMGRVYGLDVQEEKLSSLKNRAFLEKLTNVVTVLCDLEQPNGSTLQSNSLDIVLIPNVLFQADDKRAMIEEAKRVLKPEGQLLIIDWLRGSALGPKQGMVNPEEIKSTAKELGLLLKKEFSAGQYHFALLFTKQ